MDTVKPRVPIRGRLAVSHVVLLATIAAHTADHFRQGTARLTPEVLWGGTALTVLTLALLPLTMRAHPRAPIAAAAVGLWTAVAVSASHLAPHWSAFSDPYASLHLDALSWTVMLAEIAAALVFGLIGVAEMRRQVSRA
jgi:hypothetical protein